MNLRALHGVTAVLVTPYRDGATGINEDVAGAIARRADAAGIHVLTALGNTAEMHQLDPSERRCMLRAVAAGRSRALLLAGVAGSIGQLVTDAEYARDLGYDAAMLHEPPDPFGDGAGIVRYYEQVADRCPLPVVLYLRSARVKGHDLQKLARHPNIVAVKYARDDFHTLSTLVHDESAGPCVWINGLAESMVPMHAGLGVHAFTSGLANVYPEAALAMHTASMAGDLNRLRELLGLIRPIEALRNEGNARFNVSVLKEMLRWNGIEAGGVRPPNSQLTEPARARLHDLLRNWDETFASLATPH
ncbi:dihydrodipicolinate synthase family protein [Dactylosporangium sp. CA-233914]|uniref:dihydrodipicolinate synthase family protein n=1 Tax=Dactylosporangium sp. CA-233914 TaxID=3239934 RepID=UPI003D9364EE